MIWEITQDDFTKKCNQSYMPILNNIVSLMDTVEKSTTRHLSMNGSPNNFLVKLYFLSTLLFVIDFEFS